jgi:hypothetical protein
MTRVLFPLAFGSAAFLAGAIAVAQEPTSSSAQSLALSAFVPPSPASLLANGGASDRAPLSPYWASMPLRLTLLSSLLPVGPALGNGGCMASVESAGTIFPTQPYAYFALTPRLVLHGFSDLGCPDDPRALLDSGAGGGVTYEMPVAKDLSLVASGGAYGVPGNGLPTRYAAHAGLDIVEQKPNGGAMFTGIGLMRGVRGGRVLGRIGTSF